MSDVMETRRYMGWDESSEEIATFAPPRVPSEPGRDVVGSFERPRVPDEELPRFVRNGDRISSEDPTVSAHLYDDAHQGWYPLRDGDLVALYADGHYGVIEDSIAEV